MWPKAPYYWQSGRTLYCSVPFTWNLPAVRAELMQRSILWDRAVVGGPAVRLMPDYLRGIKAVTVTTADRAGVLQMVNPLATRTTVGCVRKCKFCAVPKTEGDFKELDDWLNLPILCDNNLLAASKQHFDRVIDRLKEHGWCDFNQGIDARLLTEYHARRIAEIKKPICRLALDSDRDKDAWLNAYNLLRSAGIAKSNIRTYVLIAYDSGPDECWGRCEWVQDQGIKALPQWFHSLYQLQKNAVTDEQRALGWSDAERKRLMGYYYKHRGTAPTQGTEMKESNDETE